MSGIIQLLAATPRSAFRIFVIGALLFFCVFASKQPSRSLAHIVQVMHRHIQALTQPVCAKDVDWMDGAAGCLVWYRSAQAHLQFTIPCLVDTMQQQQQQLLHNE